MKINTKQTDGLNGLKNLLKITKEKPINNNKVITLKECNKRMNNKINLIKTFKENNIKVYFKRNKLKLVLGISCLIIAFIPNGLGFLFYPLGFYLLGIGTADLYKYIEKFKDKLIRGLK